MLELTIAAIAALTLLSSLFLVLRHFAAQKALDRAERVATLASSTATADLQVQVTQLKKLLMDEIAEVNRHLNQLSDDFTVRLEAIQPEILVNLNTRLTALEAQVSTLDLSLTLKRKPNV